MDYKNNGLFFVPSLEQGIEIIPACHLGRSISYLDNGKSAADYITRMSAPLSALMHAFYGKSGTDLICPEYSASLRTERAGGEWARTVIAESHFIDNVQLKKVGRRWEIENGDELGLRIPAPGWVTAFENGLPAETSQRREDAQKIFGPDAAYFIFTPSKKIRAIARLNKFEKFGPFYIYCCYELGDSFDYIGGRTYQLAE